MQLFIDGPGATLNLQDGLFTFGDNRISTAGIRQLIIRDGVQLSATLISRCLSNRFDILFVDITGGFVGSLRSRHKLNPLEPRTLRSSPNTDSNSTTRQLFLLSGELSSEKFDAVFELVNCLLLGRAFLALEDAGLSPFTGSRYFEPRAAYLLTGKLKPKIFPTFFKKNALNNEHFFTAETEEVCGYCPDVEYLFRLNFEGQQVVTQRFNYLMEGQFHQVLASETALLINDLKANSTPGGGY